MKKSFFILIIVGALLIASSCKRSEIVDPPWDGPAGFHILLEGSATPALLFIDGKKHTSEIYVRVTNSKGAPLAGETIFFEQLASSTSSDRLDWGLFDKKYVTIKKVTNANGEVRVNFSAPLEYHQSQMVIHALMQVDNRVINGLTVPQDYIDIAMVYSGTAAAVTMK